MKAVAYSHSLPIDDSRSLFDAELPTPLAVGRDLLVRVEAISVNPVDAKVRQRVDPKGAQHVLGWDVAGTVVAAGPRYAGSRRATQCGMPATAAVPAPTASSTWWTSAWLAASLPPWGWRKRRRCR